MSLTKKMWCPQHTGIEWKILILQKKKKGILRHTASAHEVEELIK